MMTQIMINRLLNVHDALLGLLLLVIAGCWVGKSVADSDLVPLLTAPNQAGPVVVRAAFSLQDLNEVDDATETFEFSGVLSLRWRDPRQAFDPAVAGVDERIFQGEFQVNEISPGWFPQIVLLNVSGLFQVSGMMLRARPDGSATLLQTINATAETDFDMIRYPFDTQKLEAEFAILGVDRDEVRFEVDPATDPSLGEAVRVPQWSVRGVTLTVRDRAAPFAGREHIASTLVLAFDVQRNSWYMRRLIVLPLVLIVLLSFSVFWMDRSSIGDRLSVSFIGVLSAVTYQIVTNDQLPHTSHMTIMHGFLNLSFILMCLTVVVTLRISVLDRRGEVARGDIIDRRCRWVFPLAYLCLILVLLLIETMLS